MAILLLSPVDCLSITGLPEVGGFILSVACDPSSSFTLSAEFPTNVDLDLVFVGFDESPKVGGPEWVGGLLKEGSSMFCWS